MRLPPLRLAALASLLLSLPAAAQGMDPFPPDPARPEAASPRALPPAEAKPWEPGAPQRERWSTGARLGSELEGGILAMVTGAVTGGTTLGLLGLAGCGWSGIISGWSCIGGLAGAGAVVGSLVALPFGIQRGGYRAGGTGSTVAAAAGVTLSLVGAALVFERAELAVPIALTAPLLGVAGYELSDNAPAGAGLTPSVSLTPGGGSLGLQGHF